MIDQVEIYKAIGEETRLRILRILIKAKKAVCACEIIDILKKPQYTISKNLGILVNVKLIEEQRDGRMMFYKLNENDFNKSIFESIKLIKCASNTAFKNDYSRLAKRLSLRVEGQCVEGCTNKI